MRQREYLSKLLIAAALLAAGAAMLYQQGGLTGSLIPAYAESIEYTVAPTLMARIDTVHVTLGQQVKTGDVLVSLDDRAVKLALDRTNAELAQAEAELQSQRAIHKTQVVEGVLRSSSALADESAARAEAESLKGELERVEKLRAEHLVDAAVETEVRRNYLAASARVKVFERRRTQLPELYASSGAAVVETQADLRVRPYLEAVKTKAASVAELMLLLDQHVIRAPVDGTVSVLTRPVGDVIASGTEVLRLVRGRPGHLVATVPEERARGLEPGLELTVRASRGLWSQKFKGTVVEVGPSVEQLPLRSWLSPQWPRWGRRAVIEVKDATAWRAGERLHVQF
ncbi:MAG: HlyD family efflux transporter periplasmic adaptor subunit [Myxococcaceae bacterium]